MNMGVTTSQIIVFYIVMILVAFSGVIGAIACSNDKGGWWEGKK